MVGEIRHEDEFGDVTGGPLIHRRWRQFASDPGWLDILFSFFLPLYLTLLLSDVFLTGVCH